MSLIASTPIVHVGDEGTIFRVQVTEKVWNPDTSCWDDTPVDISQATVLEILFLRPGGQTRIRPAILTTDGTDGRMEYTTAAGDITEGGGLAQPWYFSGYLERPGGKKHTTDAHPFHVEAGIPRPTTLLTPLPGFLTIAAPAVSIAIA